MKLQQPPARRFTVKVSNLLPPKLNPVVQFWSFQFCQWGKIFFLTCTLQCLYFTFCLDMFVVHQITKILCVRKTGFSNKLTEKQHMPVTKAIIMSDKAQPFIYAASNPLQSSSIIAQVLLVCRDPQHPPVFCLILSDFASQTQHNQEIYFHIFLLQTAEGRPGASSLAVWLLQET